MTVNIHLLETLDYFIASRSGGNHKELAEKLGISQATLSRQLKLMKELGAPIKYDRFMQRHYYAEHGHFVVKLKFAPL